MEVEQQQIIYPRIQAYTKPSDASCVFIVPRCATQSPHAPISTLTCWFCTLMCSNRVRDDLPGLGEKRRQTILSVTNIFRRWCTYAICRCLPYAVIQYDYTTLSRSSFFETIYRHHGGDLTIWAADRISGPVDFDMHATPLGSERSVPSARDKQITNFNFGGLCVPATWRQHDPCCR